jgi:hypothetical protein
MKTRFLAVVLLFVVSSGTIMFAPRNGFAQRATTKNNDISFDFVDYLIKYTFSVQYEFKASSTQSWAVRAEYILPGQSTTAFGVGAQMRFYIIDSRALAGFNVGPTADVYFFKNSELGKSKILFALGADFAHKWFFDQFTIEPSVGLRYGITSSEVFGSAIPQYTGIYLIANLYFGFAW